MLVDEVPEDMIRISYKADVTGSNPVAPTSVSTVAPAESRGSSGASPTHQSQPNPTQIRSADSLRKEPRLYPNKVRATSTQITPARMRWPDMYSELIRRVESAESH